MIQVSLLHIELLCTVHNISLEPNWKWICEVCCIHLVVCEPVSDDPGALVAPQRQHSLHGGTCLMLNVQQPLPDPREVTQVEDIVELGRSGQHFGLYVWVREELNILCTHMYPKCAIRTTHTSGKRYTCTNALLLVQKMLQQYHKTTAPIIHTSSLILWY